ncbi:hypothetical protein COR50_20685 [Chitinophaga caeni]|uniref:Uncharacterized protein n=1 Tax=Chitinophaga caeni TaxID=2029983 RepID=A0A291QZE7_9BACT|nr:hypothetical protein COR50_20685 [Chitinophaga caeni]
MLSAVDYYPFGMQIPGRVFNGGGYRYGFNGKENDNEAKGWETNTIMGSGYMIPELENYL